jgi:hypothetical protein
MSEREIERLARDMCSYPEIRAPVQGFPGGVPWEMHMRAYEGYQKKYSSQVAIIDLYGRSCRGGFSTRELDMFIPGWRDELSERTALLKRIAELEAALQSSPREKVLEEAIEGAIISELQRVAPLSGSQFIYDEYTGVAGFDGAFRPCEMAAAIVAALSPDTAVKGEEDPVAEPDVEIGPGALRRGLAADEFEPWFQPKVAISTGQVVGVEALARWTHEGRLIGPSRFVPLFEREGLIGELTELMLERGCRRHRRWADAVVELKLSVNVSMLNLVDVATADRTLRFLKVRTKLS